ncbi:hypothetical protein VP01_510g2 [Puccinia sorghi]|uniref:Uncharacterized protein n=1 Tax=Puccinia sorghi TaxID=27349 RepID=A0A0L6UN49_9BASI|nr:hypothetical protein VP01_510g2 [Puccinia sorghi]
MSFLSLPSPSPQEPPLNPHGGSIFFFLVLEAYTPLHHDTNLIMITIISWHPGRFQSCHVAQTASDWGSLLFCIPTIFSALLRPSFRMSFKEMPDVQGSSVLDRGINDFITSVIKSLYIIYTYDMYQHSRAHARSLVKLAGSFHAPTSSPKQIKKELKKHEKSLNESNVEFLCKVVSRHSASPLDPSRHEGLVKFDRAPVSASFSCTVPTRHVSFRHSRVPLVSGHPFPVPSRPCRNCPLPAIISQAAPTTYTYDRFNNSSHIYSSSFFRPFTSIKLTLSLLTWSSARFRPSTSHFSEVISPFHPLLPHTFTRSCLLLSG